MAAGSVSPDADFSWLGDNFFKDDVSSLLSVGWGVRPLLMKFMFLVTCPRVILMAASIGHYW